jgi:hypothetical protein
MKKLSPLTQPEIDAGNALIAELEKLPTREVKYGTVYEHPLCEVVCQLKDLQYLTNFEWLISAVIKIEELSDPLVKKVWVSINGKRCSLYTYFDVNSILRDNDNKNDDGKFQVDYTTDSKHESTWRAVVDFLKWHKKHSTK